MPSMKLTAFTIHSTSTTPTAAATTRRSRAAPSKRGHPRGDVGDDQRDAATSLHEQSDLGRQRADVVDQSEHGERNREAQERHQHDLVGTGRDASDHHRHATATPPPRGTSPRWEDRTDAASTTRHRRSSGTDSPTSVKATTVATRKAIHESATSHLATQAAPGLCVGRRRELSGQPGGGHGLTEEQDLGSATPPGMTEPSSPDGGTRHQVGQA